MEVLAPTSREEFFNSYSSDPAATGFADFLFGRKVTLPQNADLSNAHIATLAILTALQTEDEALFRKSYDELSRRKPQADAPWLLNDPLFYGLVLGVVHFGGHRDWLQSTLLFREEQTRGELHDITVTLTDILRENWGNSANLRPVTLVARYHLGLDTVDPELLNRVYRIVTETPFPYCESNFLNAVYLRAFDIVILSKAPEDSAKRKATSDLIESLWRKAKIMGWFIWFIGFVIFIILAAALLFWAKGLTEGEVKEWIEALDLLGVPLIAALPCIPWFTRRKKIVGRIQHFMLSKFFSLAPDILHSTDDK